MGGGTPVRGTTRAPPLPGLAANFQTHTCRQGRSQGGGSVGSPDPLSKKNYIYFRKLKKFKFKYMYYIC